MSETNAPRAIRFQSQFFNADICGLHTTIWAQDLLENESFDDCMDRNAYSAVMASRTPKAGDTVQVRSFDRANRVDFLVVAADKSWLKLRMFQASVGKDAKVPESSQLDVRWNLGKRKFEVIRKSDKALLAGDFALKEDAIAWVADHLKQMAA